MRLHLADIAAKLLVSCLPQAVEDLVAEGLKKQIAQYIEIKDVSRFSG